VRNSIESGTWDFHGDTHWQEEKWETYSIGIFQWIPKSSKGVKKSKSIFRIIGYTNDRSALDAAEAICEALNTGKTTIDRVTEGKQTMRLFLKESFPRERLEAEAIGPAKWEGWITKIFPQEIENDSATA
jgi:hypothetical protein